MGLMKHTANKRDCKHRSKTIYIAAVFLFFALLLSIDPIISFGNKNLEKTDRLITGGQEVHHWIDSITAYGDLAEKIEIRGWAFCETAQDNKGKEIAVIFSSDKFNYRVTMDLSLRSDVTDTYKDVCQIKGDMHGFDMEFSTIGMHSGTYDIYLYCYENDTSFGYSFTGYKLVKIGRDVKIEQQ